MVIPTLLKHTFNCSQLFNESSALLCYYIAHLTRQFLSSKSIINYISMVRFLHKQLGLTQEAIDAFPITSLLSTPPLRCPPILPHLLHRLCLDSPKALHIILDVFQLDSVLYYLHSLHRGGAMAAYRAGLNQVDIITDLQTI